MSNVESTIQSVKDKLPNVTPTPPGLHIHATAHELKSRLSWGEPALTIFDVRDSVAVEERRIMGAMCLPLESLDSASLVGVALTRDIYVYGETDEATVMAAKRLRDLGFTCVAELKGGLKTWESIGGAVEGVTTRNDRAGADAYNVFSRLQKFQQEQGRESSLRA